MTPAGLVVDDVTVRFGGLVAVDGVSLHAPPGRITALIGPNGAGKTTLFNACSGFVRPDHGRIVLDGADITGASPSRRARLGLGRTFQRLELFRTLSVRRNVELAAESLHIGNDPISQLGLGRSRRIHHEAAERTAELLDLVGLSADAGRPAGELSTGAGRLLELARALARRPRMLLLDEPSSGLDAAETAGFGGLLQRIVAAGGVGVLLVEHDMDLVLSISAWIQVLDFGKPLTAGTPEEIRASAVVRDAYLGSKTLVSP